MPAKRIADVTRTAIVEYCRSGKTGTKAAREFGVSKKFVFALLKQSGVSLIRKPRILTLDDTAIDQITSTSAYWIGFIFADGYITADHPKRSPKLVVHLGEKDLGHLKKLRTFFLSEHKLVRKEASDRTYGGPSYFWSVRSRNIYNRLRTYGMSLGPRSEPAPELIRSRDFWRGVVDGDGCIGSTSSRGRFYADFKIYGYMPLLRQFCNFTGDTSLKIEKDPRQKKCWVVRAGGERATEIIRLLYANNTIALARKNKRAQAIISGNFKKFRPYR